MKAPILADIDRRTRFPVLKTPVPKKTTAVLPTAARDADQELLVKAKECRDGSLSPC